MNRLLVPFSLLLVLLTVSLPASAASNVRIVTGDIIANRSVTLATHNTVRLD